jgi:decaprenylphospho-beta-D-ribofuranose 2-oxidase
VPAGATGLADLLDRFDDRVVEAGGRVYLAKDSRVRPQVFQSMYPRLAEWQEIRSKIDPLERLHSDLARRLRLLETDG